MKKYLTIYQLTELQKNHLAWRLDHKTWCGLITAAAIARGQHGDLSLVQVFKDYGMTEKAAKIHATKVENFKIQKHHETI